MISQRVSRPVLAMRPPFGDKIWWEEHTSSGCFLLQNNLPEGAWLRRIR